MPSNRCKSALELTSSHAASQGFHCVVYGNAVYTMHFLSKGSDPRLCALHVASKKTLKVSMQNTQYGFSDVDQVLNRIYAPNNCPKKKFAQL